ncbi:hypothetical protein ABBQ32_002965 [Trebouxia sp. C0010 RCD-2024]
MAVVHTMLPVSALAATPVCLGCICMKRLQKSARPSKSRPTASHLVQKLAKGPIDLQSLIGRPLSATQAIEQQTHAELSGRWQKDKSQSDSMQKACDVVQLKWVLRRALAVLNTLEIEDTPDYLRTVIKAGGIMDVVEQYPWNGQERQHSRRDKRGGHHHGKVVRTERGPAIRVRWADPFGGTCQDTFDMSEDGQQLTQITEMVMNTGEICNYKTVYRRATG